MCLLPSVFIYHACFGIWNLFTKTIKDNFQVLLFYFILFYYAECRCELTFYFISKQVNLAM